jgi:uncharacterized protein with gpF-like domain
MVKKRKDHTVLRAVRPNAGIEAEYRARLQRLVDDMHRSYAYFLKAQYRETPPALAMDATPAKELLRELSLLGKRWAKRIDDAAPRLAEWFTRSASNRSQAALKKILRDGGMSVEFQLTPKMRDAYQATLAENVQLIKSIGSEYHTQVSGLVMRSVTAGRDLGGLAKELEHRYGVTRRRAANIALSQNNLATSTFTKVRQVDLGLQASWLHSHGGREPRPSHVANSGKPYDPAVGWFDPEVKKMIWPGTLPGCKCVSRSIVKGFT